MVKIPETKEEAVGFVGKALWWGSRLHLVGIALGVVGTIAAQLLVGFEGFRSEHQAIIRAHYQETLEAHNAFQRQIERFNAVFEGNPANVDDTAQVSDGHMSPTVREIKGAPSFDVAAQAYIREINEVSRLLPGTKEEVADYIDAIAALNRYYVVTDPPEIGSVEWVIFYGEFRVDLDAYIKTRNAYLEELSGEVGSYWRAVRNS